MDRLDNADEQLRKRLLLPHTSGGRLTELEPMPDAVAMSDDNGRSYYVMWRGVRFGSDAVLHFRRWPDPAQPWRGLGLRMSMHDLANSLRQTSATKRALCRTNGSQALSLRLTR